MNRRFNTCLLLLAGLIGQSQLAVLATNKLTVTVTNDIDIARPAEMIVVPWSEIAKSLPDTLPSHLVVKDASGTVIPTQLINDKPEEHHDYYQSIIFQHDFAAGEHTASFTLEKTDSPVPPFPSKVFARYVPERFDDFAWENDRIAHRIYGPALATPVAGRDQMTCSGVDVWCKRVRYPIIDRWYLMGHYHTDTGEGLDMYEVGRSRGCGGVGVWDGTKLYVSKNWAGWKVLSNGPIRAVFELTYGPWDAGNGMKVSETKRFTMDAGHNLDEVESTFNFQSAGDSEITVGIGIAKHTKDVTGAQPTPNMDGGWFSLWESFPKNGQIGTGVVLPAGKLVGFAEDPQEHIVLTKAKSGDPVRYLVGAGWDQSGDFPDRASWENYLAGYAQRLKSPVKVSISVAQ